METRQKKSQLYSIIIDKKEPEKRDDLVGWVPTTSEHWKCAKDRVNDLLAGCPDCTKLVYALLTYSTQKWASAQRKALGIDRNKSIELQHEADSAAGMIARIYRKTGIVPQTSGNLLDTIEDSDRILSCLDEALEGIKGHPREGKNFEAVLRAVHYGMPGSTCPDVSSFLIKEYYRDAVLYMYDLYGARIDGLVSAVISPSYVCDGGITSDAYHDTSLCLKLYPDMIGRFSDRSRKDLSDYSSQRDSDGLQLLNILERAVRGVSGYPVDGETLYWILLLIMEGKSQNEMMTVLDMGRRQLESQTARAVNLLSFVLWGYSTTQILNGVVLEPHKTGLARYNVLRH